MDLVPKGGLEPPRVAHPPLKRAGSPIPATSARGRSITLSCATDNSPDALAEPRVERVPNPLTHEVVREHRDEDREAGIDRQPPADLDRVLALVQDIAPRRVRRLDAEPEEGEPRLGEDRGGEAGRHRHEDRPPGGRQDGTPDDPETART